MQHKRHGAVQGQPARGGKTMRPSGNDVTVRYLRLVLHQHPRRGQEYLESLLNRGMSAIEVATEVLLPARERVLEMREGRQISTSDASAALEAVRKTHERVLSGLAHRAPSVRDLDGRIPHDLAVAGLVRS